MSALPPALPAAPISSAPQSETPTCAGHNIELPPLLDLLDKRQDLFPSPIAEAATALAMSLASNDTDEQSELETWANACAEVEGLTFADGIRAHRAAVAMHTSGLAHRLAHFLRDRDSRLDDAWMGQDIHDDICTLCDEVA